MKIFKEVKEIAKKNAQIEFLIDKLSNKIDTVDIDWTTAKFISLSKEEIKRFKHSNSETEDYFVYQRTGYAEDSFHGWLYFKTEVPGQYVRVYFST